MDYFSNPGHLRSIRGLTAIDLEKTAQALDEDSASVQGLPSSAFADPVHRQFPTHTKEAAVLAAGYFYAQPAAEQDSAVERRVVKAAGFWGISDQVQQLKADMSRELPAKYAMDLEIDGQHIQHFAWYDAPSVKQASEQFVDYRTSFPVEARQQAAANLLKAAGETNAELEESDLRSLARTCGLADLNSSKMAEQLLLRQAAMRKRPQHAPAINKLAQAVGLLLETDHPDRTKLAIQAFGVFDEQTDMAQNYGRGLSLPEDALTGELVVKQAADEDLVQLQNGRQVRVSEIDWSKVAVFDPDLAEAVKTSSAADVLPTWPRPDADNLVLMLGLS